MVRYLSRFHVSVQVAKTRSHIVNRARRIRRPRQMLNQFGKPKVLCLLVGLKRRACMIAIGLKRTAVDSTLVVDDIGLAFHCFLQGQGVVGLSC